MAYPVMPLGFLGSQGDNDTYQISRSLRFNSADSAYLNRTPSSAGNRKTWTWSAWIKRGTITRGILFSSSTTSFIYFSDSTPERLSIYDSLAVSGGYYVRDTNQLFRDPSAWYHIVFATDTTQATASNRVKLYINGSEVTSFAASNNPAQNAEWNFNSTNTHYVGYSVIVGAYAFDGYMAEINFIDGQALTPSSFGETDAITGRWKAKAYSGTYGTNGFYLKFADNSGTTSTTLGKDSAGTNNWTPNNFSVTAGAGNDSLVDSPTNYGSDSYSTSVDNARGCYCTLNPLDKYSSVSIANGNLDASLTSQINGSGGVRGTIGASSGKWYWEVIAGTLPSARPYLAIGIDSTSLGNISSLNNVGSGGISSSYIYQANGIKQNNNTSSSYGASYTTNDVIGVALNLDSGTLEFYKNGSSQGVAYSGISGTFSPSFSLYTDAASSPMSMSFTANFGQRPFAYTAPAGFKALCTTNLTTPTIKKPSTAMDVVTYTGTGASQSISSLGFSPDLVWIKGRSGATDHALYDVIRGSQARLESNTTDAEVTSDNGLTSFDSAGFTIGTLAQVNTNTATYVGWSWDAGSTNSTNNSGSITSTVRANPQAGFSIVSFTDANASNYTIGHGLGTAPAMIIEKNRTGAAENWLVYHKSTGATGALFLDTTNAFTSNSAYFNNTSPTASVFTLGAYTGSKQRIAYCFAEIEGYSKFGSYTGTGTTDGAFVWCGFRPRWVMVKNITAASTDQWLLIDTARDTYNVVSNYLFPNTSGAEGSLALSDFNSNGFKIRSTNSICNSNTNTYIFAAFAEAPFKYARAR